MTTKKLLIETLNQLSPEDFAEFKSIIGVDKKFTFFSKRELKAGNMQYVVELMEKLYGRGCVEETRKALMKMSRTDLVQRLSDKQFPALSQRVEMMESLIELLLETLAELSDSEYRYFKQVLCRNDDYYFKMRETDMQDTVFFMVQTYGHQSVKKIVELLKDIGRSDLAQRLSDCSSEPKNKHLDEHLSALIHKVATMAAVKELLLETLKDLSQKDFWEFRWFLKFTCFQKSVPQIRQITSKAEMVNCLMNELGQQSVEVIVEVFRDMKRTDLVQRLSESSSGLKAAGTSAEGFDVEDTEREKHSEDERWPALIHQVETMESVIELLLETLAALNDQELEEFKQVLFEIHYHRYKYDSGFTQMPFTWTDLQDTVFVMVQIYSQQSVEKTMERLKEMKRTDLAQRLSDCSSLPRKKHSVDDRRSALIHTVATMAAVKHLLLGTLNDLSNEEFKKFQRFLQMIFPRKNLLYSSWRFESSSIRKDLVDLMVNELGQVSVEATRKVFLYMKRTDLIQKLPESSSGSREKLSVDEDEAALLKREEELEAVRQILFETLKDLKFEDLNKFRLFLKFTYFKMGLPQIQTYLNMAEELVDQVVDKLGHQSVEVTRKVLTDMKRTDLVQRLSESSSGSKRRETGGSSESEDCGSMMQESSDWSKLEPEVNGTDADEAPTYSLQSEAGHFECSVSGLRWVCKEKASFQYQFGSWEGHMERMESRGYMPAGPLMDVALTAGKLNEVHLPHWICTDDIPDILDKFAVLHIDDCGDVVEKVSEVTPSHVKLIEPIFSLRAVLMKVGIPVKISCNVLIYQTNTAFLTLHVYLVPRDPGLQQVLRQREMSHGYKAILKPDPEKSLKMLDRFTLTADGAEICPPDLKLRYPSGKPNFFEVYTENPDGNFQLKLTTKKEFQPVWSCTVRKAEYQSVGHVQGEYQTPGNTQERDTGGQSPKPGPSDTLRASAGAAGGCKRADGKHFVDEHRRNLIRRVKNVLLILDELYDNDVISQENYGKIIALPTCQEQIRELYKISLNAEKSKDIFYDVLLANEKFLVEELHAKK